jgi:hypothetical protein
MIADKTTFVFPKVRLSYSGRYVVLNIPEKYHELLIKAGMLHPRPPDSTKLPQGVDRPHLDVTLSFNKIYLLGKHQDRLKRFQEATQRIPTFTPQIEAAINELGWNTKSPMALGLLLLAILQFQEKNLINDALKQWKPFIPEDIGLPQLLATCQIFHKDQVIQEPPGVYQLAGDALKAAHKIATSVFPEKNG